MKPAKAYSGTQSVVRALRLLKLFHAARPDITFAQIQKRSGLNRSTAFRILTALEAEGMIERSPNSEGYRLGPQIAALGQMTCLKGGLGDLARVEMAQLAMAIGVPVTLGVHGEKAAVVVGQGELPQPLTDQHLNGTMPRVSGNLPAHASSIGKVLLSHLSEEERQKILACGLPQMTAKTLTDMTRLNQDLEQTRERGYGLSLEEMEADYHTVAVPVHDAEGKVIAALEIGGSKDRFTRNILEELSVNLKEASACITRNLGGVPLGQC